MNHFFVISLSKQIIKCDKKLCLSTLLHTPVLVSTPLPGRHTTSLYNCTQASAGTSQLDCPAVYTLPPDGEELV